MAAMMPAASIPQAYLLRSKALRALNFSTITSPRHDRASWTHQVFFQKKAKVKAGDAAVIEGAAAQVPVVDVEQDSEPETES